MVESVPYRHFGDFLRALVRHVNAALDVRVVFASGSETTHGDGARRYLQCVDIDWLAWGFNYYGTVGSNRDEFIMIRKMKNVNWLDDDAATAVPPSPGSPPSAVRPSGGPYRRSRSGQRHGGLRSGG